jgi:hypothetical protein
LGLSQLGDDLMAFSTPGEGLQGQANRNGQCCTGVLGHDPEFHEFQNLIKHHVHCTSGKPHRVKSGQKGKEAGIHRLIH